MNDVNDDVTDDQATKLVSGQPNYQAEPARRAHSRTRIDRKTLMVWATFCLTLVLLVAFNMR
jgi:hypothetical protein